LKTNHLATLDPWPIDDFEKPFLRKMLAKTFGGFCLKVAIYA
jgi:hypothetical protein